MLGIRIWTALVMGLAILSAPALSLADDEKHPPGSAKAGKEDPHKTSGAHDSHGGAHGGAHDSHEKTSYTDALFSPPKEKLEKFFDLPFGSEKALDAKELPEPLKKAFQEHNRPLPEKTTIAVAEAGHKWVIDAEGTHYIVEKGADKLEIYREITVWPGLDLAIWTTVVFLLLLFVLSKYAWPPMLAGLRKREESIASALEEAKKARSEGEKLRADFEAERKQRGQEIAKIMEEARMSAENLRQELRTKASEEIQTERARLRREIETAKDQALNEIWTQAAQLATAISAKAIRRSLSDEDQKRLMDEALAEVSKARERGKSQMRQFGEEWVRQGGAG